ncbi:hypothetical protein [Acidiphilium angustum]|uniref:hypothetical protein n=1 Tax=Acidiphilium angustum TaxID=523 RepID=UPI0009DF9A6C|nr:hypothetical protein [Acidiphilium angustum]
MPDHTWRLTLLAAASLALTMAHAASTTAMTAAEGPMAAAVARGGQLFDHARFGSTLTWVPDMAFHAKPMTCGACHTNGGKTIGTMPNGKQIPSLIGAAADFPRYNAKKHAVFTLQRQLAHCIRAGIGGKAPAYDSPAMIDLEVYLISLSKTAPIGRNVP